MIDTDIVQVRTFQTRATADPDNREIAGIGVPLEDEIEVMPGFREVFDKDCEFVGIERAKLKLNHRELIGVITQHERATGALNIVGRASATTAGNDALVLANDGALDAFSIGFRFDTYVKTDHEDGSFTVRHTRVRVQEFSVTDDPAYTNAVVTDVRHRTPQKEGDPMPPEATTLTREDLDGLRSEMSEQIRSTQAQIATLGEREERQPARFQTFGDFIRAYHKGDSEARSLHETWHEAARDHQLHDQRAFDGTVLADTIARDPWVGDAIRLIDKGRKVLNSFQTAPLPATGSQIEYGVLESNTVTVAKQENEGDTLAKGKVSVGSDTAPVGTYGGWSELSFQAVDRADVSVLNLTRRAQLIAYAQQTEAEVRALLQTVISDNLGEGHALDLLANPKAADWIALFVDAHDAYEDAALPINGLYLSKDKFLELVTLSDTTDRLQFQVFGTGSNVVGKLSVPELTADVASTTVRLLPGSQPGRGAFYNEQAITTWENAGAPVALQDENITNLTRAYSVYGYLATASEIPDAILPVEFADAPAPGGEG